MNIVLCRVVSELGSPCS